MEIYIKLDDEFQKEKFFSKLPEIDIFSNIYFFFNNLKHFELIFDILEKIINFLNTYTFSYLRLHLVHPYKEELKYIYSKIYEFLISFNLEGYKHQVVPRLVVFPIFSSEPSKDILEFLESHFFPPGVILNKNKKIQKGFPERVFINFCDDILLSVGYQNILLNLLDNVQFPEKNWKTCSPMIVFEGKEIFPCIYAFENKLNQIDKNLCNKCFYRLLKKAFQSKLLNFQELASLHFRLGLELFEEKNMEIAEKHFLEALKFVSTKEKKNLYYYLGICKAQMNEYNSAIEYLKNSKIFNHNTYFYLGFSFFQKKDYLKAKENLEKALEFKLPLEEKISIVLYLGYTYKELEMYESAIDLCKEIAEEVFIEQAFNLMGTCYFKLKAYDKAVEYFKKAILLDPFCAIDYANLCLSLKALNKKEEARYYGKKALELDPKLEFVRKALKEMEND